MKKLLITLSLGLMVLAGVALCFQSNLESVSLASVQDEIAMSAQKPAEKCTRCWGSGKCTSCKGRGSVVGAVKRKCSDCKGTGVCQRCKGTGKLNR